MHTERDRLVVVHPETTTAHHVQGTAVPADTGKYAHEVWLNKPKCLSCGSRLFVNRQAELICSWVDCPQPVFHAQLAEQFNLPNSKENLNSVNQSHEAWIKRHSVTWNSTEKRWAEIDKAQKRYDELASKTKENIERYLWRFYVSSESMKEADSSQPEKRFSRSNFWKWFGEYIDQNHEAPF